MKFPQLIVLLIIATLTSCSSTSIDEEINLFSNEEVNVTVTISEEENELLEIINDHRVSIGLEELILDTSIYQYASSHNTYMIENDAIGHDNFSTRAENVAKTTNAERVSENVARFFQTNEQVLQGWLNSPSHRAAIESNNTHTVLSISQDSEGNNYYTQLFYK